MKILYQTRATATGGRTGTTSVDDGSLDLSLSTPKELGGAGGEGTNPEQLFASGYAACFLSALHFVAGRQKQKLSDETRVSATVGIGPREGDAGFALDVALSVTLPDLDRDLAEKLVEEAHAACPYSHLARNGVDVDLTLE